MQDTDGPADMEDDQGEIDLAEVKQERGFLVDLFPFTRPVEFYKLTEDVGRLQEVGYIVGFSTTSHPAFPLACRLMSSDCLMLSDRPSQHSINHSPVICEEYLLRKSMAELQVPVKRRLQISELQLVASWIRQIRAWNGCRLVLTRPTSSLASMSGPAIFAVKRLCACRRSLIR